MFLFRSKRFSSRSASSGSSVSSVFQRGADGGARKAPLAGPAFEAALLLAGLPAAGRECYIQRLLAAAKRPPWSVGDVGGEPAEQLQLWGPLAPDKISQQEPYGLLLMLHTELESGLRSMATPLWLLNRVVRGVVLLRQGGASGRCIENWSASLATSARRWRRSRRCLSRCNHAGG